MRTPSLSTAKMLKTSVKRLLSYNKTDLEKIAKGEKPSYDPSVWIKIYYSAEKGFDDKIVNVEGGKPIRNTDELINKDLNISSLEFYSRHIWFGPKGTSTNLTLGRCAVNYETTEYDMDDATGDASGDENQDDDNNENNDDEEVANSDDE